MARTSERSMNVHDAYRRAAEAWESVNKARRLATEALAAYDSSVSRS